MKKKLLAFVLCTTVLAMGATVKLVYRALNTTMTVTSLNSLATTANLAWQSSFVDNNTNQDVDEIVHVQVTSNASGTSSTGTINVYVYACSGGTTTCDDTITGSQGTVTLTNPTNLIKAVTCNVVANATLYNCPSFSVANQFGGTLPARWGIAIVNNTGAALNASGNSVAYDSAQLLSQ